MTNFTDYETRDISNLNYIIYPYDPMLVILTHRYKIPYVIIPLTELNLPFPFNVFYVPGISQVSSSCSRAILTRLNISSIAFLDDAENPKFQNSSDFTNFTQTKFSLSNSTNLSTIFIQQIPYNAYDVFVCALPLNNSDMITRVLNEAMIKGQLNPGKTWIFSSAAVSESSFDVFKPYARVGGNIYGFLIQQDSTTSNKDFTKLIVDDLVSLIKNSVLKPPITDRSASLRNATSEKNGKIVALANNRYNGTVVVIKKINTLNATIDQFRCETNLIPVDPNRFRPTLNSSSEIVRIGVIISKGYFMQKPSGQYYGFSVAILARLLNITKFNYVYVFPTNPGNQGPYDQLNGLIINNLADIILIPMYSPLITNLSFLSDPVTFVTINMLTRDQDVILKSITLSPFTYNVWLGIVLIILLMTLGFWAISALSPSSADNAQKKAKPYSFGFSLLVIYSSFVMAKLKIKLLKPSTQIFAFILWFSTLTVIITYVSNILPFLMTTNPNFPFNNASYFSTNPNSGFKFSFVKNSDDIGIIQSNNILKEIYTTATRDYPNDLFVDDNVSESILQTSGKILLQNSNKNGYIYNTINCTSSMIVGTYEKYPLVFAMHGNWTHKTEMGNLISNLISSGATGSLSLVYFGQGPCARSSTQNLPSPVTLTLSRLVILFLFPLMGCLVGIGFVLLATVFGKCARCVTNLKREKFHIGQKYHAKVHSIDPHGVWAFINNRDRPYYINSTSLHPDLRKQYNPSELNISSGDILLLKYFGKDPINGYKRFCKDLTDV